MNKLYSQIASLIVVVGLGTAWAFNVIDGIQFTTMSGTLLAAIFALYQKYVKDEVVKINMQLEDELSEARLSIKGAQSIYNQTVNKVNSLNEELVNLKTSMSQNEIAVLDEKPKRSRKK